MHPNIAEPAAVLAGGERSVIVVTTAALLGFSCMEEATVLRAVSSDFRDATAAFIWDDIACIEGSRVVQWRACFPNAQRASVFRARVRPSSTVPAEAFVHLRGIVTLKLSLSCFPVAALVAEQYAQLTSLKLYDNEVSDYEDDFRFTGATLAAIPRQCPLLTSLTLDNCSDVTDFAGLQCPLLTDLDLSNCAGLTNAGLAAVRCPLLRSLTVAYVSSVTNLAGLQCPLLTSLNLAWNRCITGTGLAALQCPLLTSLDLSKCRAVTDAGLAGLQCPLLTSLCLSKCSSITDAGLAGLRCPLLISLNLEICHGITTAGLAGLQCPLLAFLDLSSCMHVNIPGNIEGAQEKLRYAREVQSQVPIARSGPHQAAQQAGAGTLPLQEQFRRLQRG